MVAISAEEFGEEDTVEPMTSYQLPGAPVSAYCAKGSWKQHECVLTMFWKLLSGIKGWDISQGSRKEPHTSPLLLVSLLIQGIS